MSDELEREHIAGNDMHPVAKTLFGWTTSAKIKSRVFLGLGLLSFLLIIAELFIFDVLGIDRHPHNDAEALFGFYGIYGFVAFAFVVLMGWPLGRMLRRSENYYDDADEDTPGRSEHSTEVDD